jgi:hypothetical protein
MGVAEVKIRLWGTEDECRLAAERLTQTPGLIILSVSEPYADRSAARLVRVFVEARLDPSRAVSRYVIANHSRAVSRVVVCNHSRAVAAAGRA